MKALWRWFWRDPHQAVNRIILFVVGVVLLVASWLMPVQQAMTLVFGVLCAVTWAVSLDYVRAPWWRSAIGRGFMLRNTALAVLLSWIVTGTAGWIEFEDRGRVTAVLAAGLALTFLNFFLTLARKQHDEPYEDIEEVS